MRNFGLLVIVAAFSFTAAQDITCVFTMTGNDYECRLYSITVTNEGFNVRFTGTHASQKTDADVVKVYIYSSNTPFVIPQIFTQFSNIQELGIYYSNLQRIKLSPSVQLSVVVLEGNNIPLIHGDSFRNQTKLTQLRTYNNQFQAIDETAFHDLHNLKMLQLEANKLTYISPKTLTLPNVELILLGKNLLFYIPEEFVKGIPKVTNLILSNNNISQIHPHAFDSFKHSPVGLVHIIEMKQNVCVDAGFPLINYNQLPTYWTNMNNLLQHCFTH